MVLWHVDDLKISHKDASVTTKFIEWLSTKYKGLTIHWGKTNDYLGMDLDYSIPGVLTVSMIKYTKAIIDEFPDTIMSSAATPAADHLIRVRKNNKSIILPEDQAVAFHHTVAQLLFLLSRARRDTQTPVAFLTTRVKEPDKDNWGKLKRVLKYLKGTLTLGLRLMAEETPVVKWWVDVSHVVHEDCKSHTGASMSMGKGMAITISCKQKINGKSSTESEIIGVDNALPHIFSGRNTSLSVKDTIMVQVSFTKTTKVRYSWNLMVCDQHPGGPSTSKCGISLSKIKWTKKRCC